MKKFINEFKTFALRGNVLDMAVGVIIGGAFTGIVTSLKDNFIQPILNFCTGAAKYGWSDVAAFGSAFISCVIEFIITAFVLFVLIRLINTVMSLGKKKVAEEPAAPTTKVCPFCKTEISIDATRCPNCTSEIE